MLRYKRVEAFLYKHIAIHVYSSLFINRIKTYSICRKSPFLSTQCLRYKITANSHRISIGPAPYRIIRQYSLPTCQTYFYFNRKRIITKPAQMNYFRNHTYIVYNMKRMPISSLFYPTKVENGFLVAKYSVRICMPSNLPYKRKSLSLSGYYVQTEFISFQE